MLFLLQDNGSDDVTEPDPEEDPEKAPNGAEDNKEPLLSSEEVVTNKGNINVRAAFIHALGDLMQSIGVLTAAFIIYFKVKISTMFVSETTPGSAQRSHTQTHTHIHIEQK